MNASDRKQMWQVAGWTLAVLVLIALIASMAGCASTPKVPEVPKVATVVIEKPKKLPDWATAILPNPQPENGTVGALETNRNARGFIIDYVNCRSLLLLRLDRGEAVDAKECEQP